MNEKGSGVVRRSIFFIAVSMSLYHLYSALFGAPEALLHRAIHLSFTLVLIFLVYPLSKQKRATRWADFAFMGLGMSALLYLFINYDYFITRYPYVHPLSNADLILGILLVVTLLEAAHRSIGWAMAVTALAFIFYTYIGPYLPGLLHHPGSNTETIIDQLYMTTEGIFGIPLGVSATYVILFVIFGAFLERSGGGNSSWNWPRPPPGGPGEARARLPSSPVASSEPSPEARWPTSW